MRKIDYWDMTVDRYIDALDAWNSFPLRVFYRPKPYMVMII